MKPTLPTEVQKWIDDRVKSGRYSSAEDVVTAAVSNLEQQERVADLSAEELVLLYPDVRQKLAEGLAAARAGRFVDGEALFDELERRDADATPNQKAG